MMMMEYIPKIEDLKHEPCSDCNGSGYEDVQRIRKKHHWHPEHHKKANAIVVLVPCNHCYGTGFFITLNTTTNHELY
tara:strand:+ start:1828 stop:2058 length:231 start_codon:yes stop_codon:yes gene_type:complete